MMRQLRNWVVLHDRVCNYIRFSRKPPIQQIRTAVRMQHLSGITPLHDVCAVFPKTITIETTNICNAFCVFCPHSRMKRKQSIMIPSLFEKIITEAKELGVKDVVLSFFGEPLCDRDLFNRIAFAKKNGLRVTFYTNAILLNEEVAQKIIDSGVDRVCISLDSYSPEHYKKIRLVGKYDEVINGINNLMSLREKRKSLTPAIEIGMLVLDRADKVAIRSFMSQWKHADNIVIRQRHEWVGKGTTIKNKLPCYPLWNDFYVLCDGRVVPCCMDYDGDLVIGDTNKQSLKDIWENSEKLRQIRKCHLENKGETIGLCKTCTVITSNTYPWWYFK
jgi:MoaA/NifB/PqqE/SkfB family radical SAM enzyme